MENNYFDFLKKWKYSVFAAMTLLGLFMVALIVFLAAGASNKVKEGRYIGQEIESQNTIVVSGTGEVYARPDLAISTLSVITEGKTAAEAMKENTDKMNAVIVFAKGQGIEDKDLKTTGFNVYPRYEWQRDADISLYPQGKRILAGYEASQSLEIKIRDLDKIGQIIEGATAAGANQAGDLQFTVDQKDEFENQARQEAIDRAKAKARELASQLGVRLVKISSFSESGGYPVYYGNEKAAAPMAMGIGGGDAAPSIQTGENKISVSVTIVYEIR